MRSLGDIAREARQGKGWTQAEAGMRTGRCQRVVSDFETGNKDDLHTLEYAVAVAKAAGRTDLVWEAIERWSGLPFIGCAIPDGIELHPAGMAQLVSREQREREEVFARIDLWRDPGTQRERYRTAAVEQAQEIMAEIWQLRLLCDRAGMDLAEVFTQAKPREVVAV